RAAARAESLFGAGVGMGIFLYVTVGTGISSCLVMDGRPFTGCRGAAGTMASGPWTVECDQCGAVARYTLEQIASGPALVARYNREVKGSLIRAEQVITAAGHSDPDALRIIQSAAQLLGMGVGWL